MSSQPTFSVYDYPWLSEDGGVLLHQVYQAVEARVEKHAGIVQSIYEIIEKFGQDPVADLYETSAHIFERDGFKHLALYHRRTDLFQWKEGEFHHRKVEEFSWQKMLGGDYTEMDKLFRYGDMRDDGYVVSYKWGAVQGMPRLDRDHLRGVWQVLIDLQESLGLPVTV